MAASGCSMTNFVGTRLTTMGGRSQPVDATNSPPPRSASPSLAPKNPDIENRRHA